jgi:pimeloyl-ACP methyl ester carboxylesterase
LRVTRRSRDFIVLVAAVIGLSLGADAAQLATFDPGPYLSAQRLVDIGGRRLNLYCSGTSSPTVVLDAGLGGTMALWRLVQLQVAKTTRVCSYDRAGMGFSDPAPPPRDAAAIVTDLHALLHRAGIAPPYVVVGHSVAGLYDRLYADRYPNDVAGMVLVDPVYPHQARDFEMSAPVFAKSLATEETFFSKCSAAASSHELIPGSTIFGACGLLDATELRKQCDIDGFAICRFDELQNNQQSTAAYWQETASEYEAMRGASSTEVQNEQRNYGNLPLMVLTREKGGFGDTDTPVSAEQNLEMWKQMHAAHQRIAATSTAGTDVVVAHSGHDIQFEYPAAVIFAIEKVVDQVRRAQP